MMPRSNAAFGRCARQAELMFECCVLRSNAACYVRMPRPGACARQVEKMFEMALVGKVDEKAGRLYYEDFAAVLANDAAIFPAEQ